MGIFNWFQNTLSAKQYQKKRSDAGSGTARYSSTTDTHKEEFSDWPEGFLAIGTFGNKELKEEPDNQRQPSDHETPSSRDLMTDFTLEEVCKLRKELTKLLAHKPKSSTDGSDRSHLPLNRFLNCPSSLEVDRKARIEDEITNNGDLSHGAKIILTKARDILIDEGNAIKKRSLTLLLKKMFVCRGGFGPSPSFRDPMPESRMEKILRSLLHKNLHAQNQTPASLKRFLENKPIDKKLDQDKMEKRREDACQWVKTDSEYIVLEI